MDPHILTVGGNTKLDAIVGDKIKELERAKQVFPLEEIKRRLFTAGKFPVRNFRAALEKNVSGLALIAEIKPASPSAGDINTSVNIEAQAKQYEAGGASALSVLTDARFKGELGYLKQIKLVTTIPVLRKDFIFDPYQIYESRVYGADALLLIASIVTPERLRELVDLTHELGLECLLEVHTEEDLTKALATQAAILGINARDLRTFTVDFDTVINLANQVPPERFLIAESGIVTAADVKRLVAAGARGILVGTTLMQATDVGAKIKELRLI